MIHIAICDDEQLFIQQLSELLKRYSVETECEMRITTYSDGCKLVENYDTTIDLVFLDIKMDRMNGLQAAEKIRKIDAKVGIIFLTTLARYALEGYKYQATNYIMKPMKYIRLKSEMDSWLKKHYAQAENPHILVANDHGRYKVFLNTLRYIETFNRNLMFHTEQENILCYKTMKEVELPLLTQGFARCHTSYIVNLFFVKNVEGLEIILISGERLPISQPKRKEFMQQLAEYWGEML
ncbi:MAG: LytTR family DNA-binding domain-containing protein [Anaerostipes sp.]|nr:LytTR family DNA-binding domain-containing protein [Anaerostipes sp.]